MFRGFPRNSWCPFLYFIFIIYISRFRHWNQQNKPSIIAHKKIWPLVLTISNLRGYGISMMHYVLFDLAIVELWMKFCNISQVNRRPYSSSWNLMKCCCSWANIAHGSTAYNQQSALCYSSRRKTAIYVKGKHVTTWCGAFAERYNPWRFEKTLHFKTSSQMWKMQQRWTHIIDMPIFNVVIVAGQDTLLTFFGSCQRIILQMANQINERAIIIFPKQIVWTPT